MAPRAPGPCARYGRPRHAQAHSSAPRSARPRPHQRVRPSSFAAGPAKAGLRRATSNLPAYYEKNTLSAVLVSNQSLSPGDSPSSRLRMTAIDADAREVVDHDWRLRMLLTHRANPRQLLHIDQAAHGLTGFGAGLP